MTPKRLLIWAMIAVGAAMLIFGPVGEEAFAGDVYQVDTVHSYILFRIKHLGIGYSYGRINGVTGEYRFDPASPEQSVFLFQADAAGVDTDNDKRDAHIRSGDFFDVARFPTIRFKSSAVKRLDEDRLEISGDLTFRGQTRPITVEARHTGSGKDPWGKYRSGFETRFTINRSDFGMTFMMTGLSDAVDLTVSVEGIRQ
jgi:polyisoprenoid-binding protein YceI